jgi:hypothetical protein
MDDMDFFEYPYARDFESLKSAIDPFEGHGPKEPYRLVSLDRVVVAWP